MHILPSDKNVVCDKHALSTTEIKSKIVYKIDI